MDFVRPLNISIFSILVAIFCFLVYRKQSMVLCACVSERNLLADVAKIVDKNKIGKRKDDFCRKIVTDGLLALGYDASICKSRWEKSSSYPAGID